jgi:hypothetical protein
MLYIYLDPFFLIILVEIKIEFGSNETFKILGADGLTNLGRSLSPSMIF